MSEHAQHFGIQQLGYGQVPQMPGMPSLHGHVSIAEGEGGKTFSQTLASLVNRANNIMGEPEKLSIEAVTTGNVDIHEVMIALGKSEVAFKLMTAVTQKGIGAFDKLTSMQV